MRRTRRALTCLVAAASAIVALAGWAPASAASPGAPPASYDVRGGDPFSTAQARCTIGFSVVGGYVTASQCADTGATTFGYNQVAQGTVEATAFPDPGIAFVRVNADWSPAGVVNEGGATAAVHGSQPAPVGSAACQAGSTTALHCGVIVGRNVSVTFPSGVLTGLIQTSICSEPGDTGAPLISGDQAQGILIGWTGNCTTGGSSFYVPITTALQQYGLTLVTGA